MISISWHIIEYIIRKSYMLKNKKKLLVQFLTKCAKVAIFALWGYMEGPRGHPWRDSMISISWHIIEYIIRKSYMLKKKTKLLNICWEISKMCENCNFCPLRVSNLPLGVQSKKWKTPSEAFTQGTTLPSYKEIHRAVSEISRLRLMAYGSRNMMP